MKFHLPEKASCVLVNMSKVCLCGTSPEIRCCVCRRRVSLPITEQNCLGLSSPVILRVSGSTLFPSPPASMPPSDGASGLNSDSVRKTLFAFQLTFVMVRE